MLKRSFEVELEAKIKVHYKGIIVGEYAADLLVNRRVIVELKVAKEYQKDDEPQLLNGLKATKLHVGLLINFGRTKVAYKRFIFSNDPVPASPASL